jgi:dTDP-4-dehydrorhamnose 3,5-epimerase-like enzyme
MLRQKPNYRFYDKRGIFIEVWKSRAWRQMNYFSCKRGGIRGGHYHKKTRELFFIINGLCRVTLIDVKTHKEKSFLAKAKDIFILEPFYAHYIQALKNAEVITVLDRYHNARKPDMHLYKKDEL